MNNKNNVMNNCLFKKFLYNKIPLTILSFITRSPGILFSADEIVKLTKASRGATNQVLRFLADLNFITREKKGSIYLYKSCEDNLTLIQFKIFENLLELNKFIQEAGPYCYKIILFGSCADGSNRYESDIDLFIVTSSKEHVQKIVYNYSGTQELSERRIQAVMVTPDELLSEDEILLNEVNKGKAIWERSINDEDF